MNRESSSLSPPTIYVRGCANMREWLSGRASPCQGESRGFDPRLPLHPYPPRYTPAHTYTYVATSPSGKARLCKSCISGSNPLVASQSDVILFVGHVFFFRLVIGRPHATAT